MTHEELDRKGLEFMLLLHDITEEQRIALLSKMFYFLHLYKWFVPALKALLLHKDEVDEYLKKILLKWSQDN